MWWFVMHARYVFVIFQIYNVVWRPSRNYFYTRSVRYGRSSTRSICWVTRRLALGTMPTTSTLVYWVSHIISTERGCTFAHLRRRVLAPFHGVILHDAFSNLVFPWYIATLLWVARHTPNGFRRLAYASNRFHQRTMTTSWPKICYGVKWCELQKLILVKYNECNSLLSANSQNRFSK